MVASSEHEQVAELLGAYALDAVRPEQRSVVERHVAECPRCRSEVDELHQVAADLALLGGIDGEQPPAEVWERIVAGIGAAATAAAPSHAAMEALAVDLAAERRRRLPARRRNGRGRAWRGVVVGAAAAAIAGLAVGLARTEGQVHQLQSALAARGPQAAMHAALASPAHRVVDLRSGGGALLAEVVVRHDGTGYVVRSTMSRLPATESYQLWASINGRPISLGLLGRQPAADAAFSLGSSATGARELMVTVEPVGGVPAPDRAPLATAPLPLT